MDQQEIREAVLSATRDWMLPEEVQAEVVAARERSGESRPHVPIQLVERAIEELVEDEQLERQTGELVAGAFLAGSGEQARYRWHTQLREVGEQRLAAVLRHLLPPPGRADHVVDDDDLVAAVQAEGYVAPPRLVLGDLEILRRAKLVSTDTAAGRDVHVLREQAVADLVAAGASDLARRAWPHTPEASAEEAQDGFVAETTRELAAEKRRRSDAEQRVAKLRDWLDAHNVDADSILGVEKPAPIARKTFVWVSKPRKIDAAEKGQMLQEIIALDAQIAQHRGELEANRDFHKGKIKALEKSIAELKHLSTCEERVLELEAYRETDWEAGVDIIRAVSDGRELGREPIPRGTQRPLLEDAEPASSSASQASEVGDGPRVYTDGRSEALEVLRAGDALTQQELLDAIGEGWVCPAGWELQVRKAIAQLAKEGAVRIVQGRPPRYRLVGVEEPKDTSVAPHRPAPAVEADDEDEELDDELEEDRDLDADDEADPTPESEPAPKARRARTPKRAAKRAPRLR